MTRRRWIADEISGTYAALTGAHAEHLSRVLRARVGQVFDIVDGARVSRGRVTVVADGRVEFELGEEIPSGQCFPITLALAIFKFDRMEWAIEKCTELGVTRIIPIVSERTEPHLAAAAVKRVERWERISRQASEQSRRAGPPEISPPMKLGELVKLSGGVRIALSEHEREMPLKNALQDAAPSDDVILSVGPEGGWTNTEIDLFRNSGWISASLGSTVLRAETAAIAAVAVALAEMK